MTQQIDKFSLALIDKSHLNGNGFKRELFQIEKCKEKVEIIVDTVELWNLFECLQAVYKFAINDKLKHTIYETFSMKEILRIIVFHGNETEQEYAFKVLNQLCFDKNIAADILNDKNFLKLMDEIIKNKTNQKSLIKTVNGILWLINKIDENIGKHINAGLMSKIFMALHLSQSLKALNRHHAF